MLLMKSVCNINAARIYKQEPDEQFLQQVISQQNNKNANGLACNKYRKVT